MPADRRTRSQRCRRHRQRLAQDQLLPAGQKVLCDLQPPQGEATNVCQIGTLDLLSLQGSNRGESGAQDYWIGVQGDHPLFVIELDVASITMMRPSPG